MKHKRKKTNSRYQLYIITEVYSLSMTHSTDKIKLLKKLDKIRKHSKLFSKGDA